MQNTVEPEVNRILLHGIPAGLLLLQGCGISVKERNAEGCGQQKCDGQHKREHRCSSVMFRNVPVFHKEVPFL